MIDLILLALIVLPFIMLLEAKQNVRSYIFSGKLFFGGSHEVVMKPRTQLFLAIWLLSIPASIGAIVLLLFRWYS